MRLQYIGPDEDPYLKHGQHYEIEDKSMKSGKHRLTFVDTGFKMTVNDDEFKRIFLKPMKWKVGK